jgi:hypothetical protein
VPDKPFAESCEQNRAHPGGTARGLPTAAVLEIGSAASTRVFRRQLRISSGRPPTCPITPASGRLERLQRRRRWHSAPDGWRGAATPCFGNTLHIGLAWVECFAGGRGARARRGAGGIRPFNYNGGSLRSNARFDAWLKARDPASGVRDFEAVDTLARAQGLTLQQDIAMPANNRMLVWRKN